MRTSSILTQDGNHVGAEGNPRLPMRCHCEIFIIIMWDFQTLSHYGIHCGNFIYWLLVTHKIISSIQTSYSSWIAITTSSASIATSASAYKQENPWVMYCKYSWHKIVHKISGAFTLGRREGRGGNTRSGSVIGMCCWDLKIVTLSTTRISWIEKTYPVQDMTLRIRTLSKPTV